MTWVVSRFTFINICKKQHPASKQQKSKYNRGRKHTVPHKCIFLKKARMKLQACHPGYKWNENNELLKTVYLRKISGKIQCNTAWGYRTRSESLVHPHFTIKPLECSTYWIKPKEFLTDIQKIKIHSMVSNVIKEKIKLGAMLCVGSRSISHIHLFTHRYPKMC